MHMIDWFSSRIFLGPAQRRLFRRGWPILTYHKIATPAAGTADPFLYVSPEQFGRQMAMLGKSGFASASLDQVFGTEGRPLQPVVVTFDDGCLNVLEHGLPVLARHKVRAIQFLVSDFLGRRNEWDVAKGDVAETLMTESQVREWLAAGHEIGSHSATHPNLRHVSPGKAKEEILGSKKSLEDRFGTEIRHFCYPYGSYNDSVRELAGEAGYRTACTMQFGVNPPGTPHLELRRVLPLSNGEMLAKIRHRLMRKIKK
jgi:peptidoglycan/xylan/chitin deacetylase (PgdA/CDA1 family)